MGRWGHPKGSLNVRRRLKGPAWGVCPVGGWRLEKGEARLRLVGEETLWGLGQETSRNRDADDQTS